MRALLFSLMLLASVAGTAQCDATKRPILFVHGFLASGDTWSGQVQRFISAGYCPERLFVFDWNSVGANGKGSDSLLQATVDDILNKTGADKIDLVGHSAGGGLGRGYLLTPENARKVAHYVHIGSRKWFKEYDWFRNSNCLNIFSAADRVTGNAAGPIEGVTNIDLKDKDHYEVATSRESFEAIYTFFNEAKPASVTANETLLQLSGRAVMLGDNEPMKDARVYVYRINPRKGKRMSAVPLASFTIGATGYWGPFVAKPGEYYEMELQPPLSGGTPISYFFEPFTRPDNHIYLRGFPRGNMIAMMLGNLPVSDLQSVLVIYSGSQAMVAGRDSVTVNGTPVSSPQLTPAAKTIISSFVFDDGDGNTSGTVLKQYGSAPFIGGVDVSLPANRRKPHTVIYNGRTLRVPAASSRERILLTVFR